MTQCNGDGRKSDNLTKKDNTKIVPHLTRQIRSILETPFKMPDRQWVKLLFESLWRRQKKGDMKYIIFVLLDLLSKKKILPCKNEIVHKPCYGGRCLAITAAVSTTIGMSEIPSFIKRITDIAFLCLVSQNLRFLRPLALTQFSFFRLFYSLFCGNIEYRFEVSNYSFRMAAHHNGLLRKS